MFYLLNFSHNTEDAVIIPTYINYDYTAVLRMIRVQKNFVFIETITVISVSNAATLCEEKN